LAYPTGMRHAATRLANRAPVIVAFLLATLIGGGCAHRVVHVPLPASPAGTGQTAQQPPVEAGPFVDADLVELVTLDRSMHLDIRYATTNNFGGRVFYPEARAFLQRPAAQALVRVNAALKPRGFGLLVFDGYRPWSVTKVFWDITPPEKREFVADPAKGSKHNRGCAIDLTLYDLRTGREIDMPSAYDEMSPRAYPSYDGGTAAQREHRDLLRAAMEAEGFTVETNEWWHFNYRDWMKYPILNVSFQEIGRR
jgi:zinc D-Ala-D-Ala dipeptidase